MKVLSKEGLRYFLLKLKSWSNDTFINKNDTKEVYENDTEEVFTTDVENVSTVDVDTEPIEGSNNLITSGGVVSIVKNPIYPRVMTAKHGNSDLSIGWNAKNKIKLTEYGDVKDCEQINVINSDNGSLILLAGHDNYNLVINNTNTVRKAAMYSGTYTYWKFYSIDEEDFVTFYETIDDIPQDVEIYLMTELAFGDNSYWVFLSSIIDSNRLKIGLISKEETTHWYEAVQKARDGECICYDDMETIITDKENIVWLFKYKSIENPEYVEKYAQKWVEKIATLGTGKNSVKFGEATNASGSNSVAFGSETSSVGNNQVVIGKNNREDENKLLIVGYGKSGKENNVLTVDYDGNLNGAGIIRTSGDVVAFSTQDEEASLSETNKKVNDIWFGQKEEFLATFGNDNPMNFDNGNFTTFCKIPRTAGCKLIFKIDYGQDRNLIEYTLTDIDVNNSYFEVDGTTETISYTLRYNWSEEETLEFVDLTHVSDQTKLNGSYYGNIKADYFKPLETKSIHLVNDKLVNYGGRIDFGDIDSSTGKGRCYIEEAEDDELTIYGDVNVEINSPSTFIHNANLVDSVNVHTDVIVDDNSNILFDVDNGDTVGIRGLYDKTKNEPFALAVCGADGEGRISCVSTPEDPMDATNKDYVDNAIADNKQVFVAIYGETTYAQLAAEIAVRPVVCYYNSRLYILKEVTAAYAVFSSFALQSNHTISVSTTNTWVHIASRVELEVNRQTTIPDNADNDHYPTSKAVADYVEARAEQVFVAKYGETTYSEITAAYNAGKSVICNYGNRQYVLYSATVTIAIFNTTDVTGGQIQYRLSVNAQNAWSVANVDLSETLIVTADFDEANMTISNASHTFAEIAAAYDAKKIVFLRAGSSEFEATAKVVNAVQFSAPSGSITYTAIVRDTGVWTVSKVEKVNEIIDSATNSQYPSALAVVNYVNSVIGNVSAALSELDSVIGGDAQ